jgi:DNA-binding Lrp family transcriptional regulator
MSTIDRLDTRLLALLAADARAGVVELAQTLGVSRQTVQARLRRLEEERVLQGFIPRVDLEAAGIAVQAFASLALEQGRFDEVVARLRQLPHVLEVHVTTGREDLLVRLASRTHAELQDLIRTIVSMPGVAHANTSIALTTPLPLRVQPLLDEVTKDAGFGRSTPQPDIT